MSRSRNRPSRKTYKLSVQSNVDDIKNILKAYLARGIVGIKVFIEQMNTGEV